MPDASNHAAFSRFLRFWRGVKKLSQEDLASLLDSSPRHISRLENGSGRPSESMVQDICRVMKLGRRDSNHMLIAAGFSPVVEQRDFQSPDLKWLRKAMLLTLKALDPHPAVLLGSNTEILMVNRGWVAFFGSQLPKSTLDSVTNHYHFMFDRNAAGKMMIDWETTLSIVLMSLQQEVLFGDNDQVAELTEALVNNPNAPLDWADRAAEFEPMASFRMRMRFDGQEQKFFSVNSTVGALGPARFVSAPQLTINCLYPEDETFDLARLVHDELQHPLLFY